MKVYNFDKKKPNQTYPYQYSGISKKAPFKKHQLLVGFLFTFQIITWIIRAIYGIKNTLQQGTNAPGQVYFENVAILVAGNVKIWKILNSQQLNNKIQQMKYIKIGL